MNTTIRPSRGFTLIEILVSIGIMAFLVVTTVVAFRSGQQEDAVRSAATKLADTLRTAQNYSLSGKVVRGNTPSPAYGVKITKPGTVILYADINGGASLHQYDAGEELVTVNLTVQSKDPIQVTTIDYGGGNTPNSADISFVNDVASSALGTMKIDNADTPNQVVITLTNTANGKTKTVTANRVTGRIDAAF